MDNHAQLHGLVLALCCGMVVAACLLEFPADQPARLCLFGKPLPRICLMKRLSGISCPGCGLARSWVALLNGQIGRSQQNHRLGGMVLVYVLLQITIRLAWFVAKSHRPKIVRFGYWIDRGLILVIVALLGNWLLTLA